MNYFVKTMLHSIFNIKKSILCVIITIFFYLIILGLMLPHLPEKSFLSRFNPEFLQTRCAELDKFLKYLLKQQSLLEDQYLIQFLTEQKLSDSKLSLSPSNVFSYLGKTMSETLIDFQVLFI